MSYTSSETQILKQMDWLAKLKQTWMADLDGQDTLWNLCDAAQNSDYENTVKGSDLSTLDDKLANAQIGLWASSWFTNHNSYFNNKLGYSSGLTSWLDAKHLRVNEDFAQIYYEVYGTRLSAKYVFPENNTTNLIATLEYDGTDTLGDGLSSNFAATRIAVRGSSDIDGSNEVIIDSIQVKNTNQNVTATFTDNIAVGANDVVYLGESTPSSITTVGNSTTIVLGDNDGANLTGFSAGQYALVVDTTPAGFDLVEFVIINSYDSNSKSIVVPALVHTYNLGNTRVYPCFNKVEAITIDGASTATAGSATITPAVDRVAALTY